MDVHSCETRLTFNEVKLIECRGSSQDILHLHCFPFLHFGDLGATPSKVLHEKLRRLRDQQECLFGDHAALRVLVDQLPHTVKRQRHEFSYSDM